MGHGNKFNFSHDNAAGCYQGGSCMGRSRHLRPARRGAADFPHPVSSQPAPGVGRLKSRTGRAFSGSYAMTAHSADRGDDAFISYR
jgi:hypothetical protein